MKDHLNIENSVRANHGGEIRSKAAKEEFAAALKKAGVPDKATIKAALVAQRDEERAGSAATPKSSDLRTPAARMARPADTEIGLKMARAMARKNNDAEAERKADKALREWRKANKALKR